MIPTPIENIIKILYFIKHFGIFFYQKLSFNDRTKTQGNIQTIGKTMN